MSRDGFMLLAFGFTGERAGKFKQKIIEAFNAMEAELRRRRANELPAIDVRNPDQLAIIASQLVALTSKLQSKVPPDQPIEFVSHDG
jgi:Phage regulatory protein Rha (Phage_pRha)